MAKHFQTVCRPDAATLADWATTPLIPLGRKARVNQVTGVRLIYLTSALENGMEENNI